LTSSTDPATDHMLCMAVDCKAIATKHTLCEMVMEKTGKTERHKIRFCEDHYLRQMAYQYATEHKKWHHKENQIGMYGTVNAKRVQANQSVYTTHATRDWHGIASYQNQWQTQWLV
jgi:hypothetical protein